MKKKLFKITSILLAFILIITAMPTFALAATTEDGQYSYNVLFTKDDVKYIELYNYQGSQSSVVVPSEIDGMKVLSLHRTFDSNKKVKSITVSEGIEGIDYYTFRNCSISISLPSTLKYIGSDSFMKATINEINFPEGLEAIDFRAFENAVFAKPDIKLPDGLKYIGELAFDGSNLKSIEIGSSAKIANIDYTAGVGVSGYDPDSVSETRNPFRNSAVQSITVDADNPYLTAESGVLYNKDKTVLISYSGGGSVKRSFEIPESVETVVHYAFSGTQLNELTLNSTMTSVNNYSFYGVSAQTLNFGNSCKITEIGNYAFYNSTLSSLVIPASVEQINSYAFAGSSITSLSFEQGSKCRTVNQYAFYQCKQLESVTIASSVASIETNAFSDCAKLKTVVFEDNSMLKSISGVFMNCPYLSVIDFGDNSALETVGSFYSSGSGSYGCLKSIDFSGCVNLTLISDSAFSYKRSLEVIDLSSTQISKIPDKAFIGCTALKKVILPDCTDTIGNSSFSGCTALAEINTDNIIKIGTDAFHNCTSLPEIPTVSEERNYNGFKYYETNSSIIISGYTGSETDLSIPAYINSKPVTKILDNSFKGMKIDSVSFPETLERIGSRAFYMCNLKSISKLPDGLTYIGESAFSMNFNLGGTLEIPASIHSVSESAFSRCAFTEIIINEGVNTINKNAFYMNSCESIVIPDSVTSIGNKAFYCETLKSVTFGHGISDIEGVIESTFLTVYDDYSEVPEPDEKIFVEEYTVPDDMENYATENGILYNKDKSVLLRYPQGKALKSFTIGEGVAEIATLAFYCTKELQEVIIPNTVKVIGESAFKYSISLESVIFESGVSLESLDSTFLKCPSLKNVLFEDNVSIKMMFSVFAESGLEKIDLNCNAQYISGVFCNCTQLKDVKLYDGIAEIEDYCFRSTAIESIVIPQTVTELGDFAFAYCSDLNYINLSNVKILGHGTFANCTSLESIDLTGVLYIVNIGYMHTFENCPNLKKFYFTQEEKDAYIAANEFKGNETVETVVIGNSISEIQDGAFADCTNLETAVISSSVTSIADTAFDNCDNLTIVCLEDSYVHEYAELKLIPCKTFRVEPIADCEYTGREITPELTVSIGSEILTAESDYMPFYENNINVGTAKVTVAGLGDYSVFACLVKFNIVKSESGENSAAENNGGTAQGTNGSDSTAAGTQQNGTAGTQTANQAAPAQNTSSGSTAGNQSTSSAAQSGQGTASAGTQGEAASTESEALPDLNSGNDAENESKGSDSKKQSLWEKIVAFLIALFTFIIGKLKELFA